MPETRKIGRPKATAPKVHIGFRLATDVVASLKASGRGYNARVERALREAGFGAKAMAPPTLDLSRLTFVFAKTMPEIPREYVVRTVDNEADFVALFRIIPRHGEFGRFQGRRYRYWRHDGWQYWAMPDFLARCQIINRAKLDNPGDAPERRATLRRGSVKPHRAGAGGR
jgi:hypothetical protein